MADLMKYDPTEKRVKHLRLTDEQKKILAESFEPEVIERLEAIQVSQVAGFVKMDVVLN